MFQYINVFAGHLWRAIVEQLYCLKYKNQYFYKRIKKQNIWAIFQL